MLLMFSADEGFSATNAIDCVTLPEISRVRTEVNALKFTGYSVVVLMLYMLCECVWENSG